MKVTFRRHENINKGVLATVDHNNYVMFVMQGMTVNDHNEVNVQLQKELGSESIDLFYPKNLTSVVLFDASEMDLDSARLKQLIPEYVHVTVFNGSVLGKRIPKLSVTNNKGEIKISKEYQVLLTLRKENN